jgi:hypothetical protein
MAAAAYSAKRRSDSETGYARPRLSETSGDFKMPARRQPLLSDRPSHDAPRLDIPARTRRQGGSAAKARDPRFATGRSARRGRRRAQNEPPVTAQGGAPDRSAVMLVDERTRGLGCQQDDSCAALDTSIHPATSGPLRHCEDPGTAARLDLGLVYRTG